MLFFVFSSLFTLDRVENKTLLLKVMILGVVVE